MVAKAAEPKQTEIAASATVAPENPLAELHRRLTEPFPEVFIREGPGKIQLTYVTGEQVVSRLNDVLGPTGWSFSVKEHGINSEADEAWVLGELVIYSHLAQPLLLALIPEGERPQMILVRRQQFGSQKIKRSRSTGAPQDIGFDFKAAGTDALKKCASLIGVGLWLSKREGGVALAGTDQQAYDESEDALTCTECKQEIRAKQFANDEYWSAQDVAARSRDANEGKPLCYKCLRKRLAPAKEGQS